MIPTEITIVASALPPLIHEALTERRRFNFMLTQGSVKQMFDALAEQASEPGLIRIFDMRPTPSIRLGDLLSDLDSPTA